MSASPSAATWRRVIDQAHDGDPRHLLELLLVPSVTDGRGAPLPGSFSDLPDDGDLRQRIVEVLVFGPLRKGWHAADTLDDLVLKTGWGKGKPSLSDYEVSMAAAAVKLGVGSMHDMAEGLGIDCETLRKKIAKRRKRNP